jgi:hypothetical protein
MLSYPLCPFFVVFCNVVGTSDARDFQLLQDVTDGISTLVSKNKYVHRLHRLCETLLGLSKPLVQPTAPNSHASAAVPIVQVAGSSLPTLDAPVVLDTSNASANGFMTSTWNDDMMSQLFQFQPSLDWFNADILDPTWDFNMAK